MRVVRLSFAAIRVDGDVLRRNEGAEQHDS